MSNQERIIRYWKDEDFRQTAGEAMPAHPAGAVELDDADLRAINGATTFLVFCQSLSVDCDNTIFHGTCKLWTAGCCTSLTDVA